MSSIALPAAPVVDARPMLRQLAWLEAKRFARHPLFLTGLLLGLAASAGERGPIELDYQVIPSFFIGVFGLAVASQLTTSTQRSRPLLDAAPVPRGTQTAALCLACLVPAAAGIVMVLLHRAFVAADPIPTWMHGTYGATDWFLITAVIPVIACLGGPLLGVAVGRWLRFPGATLLAVVVVLFWCNLAAYVPAQSMDAESLPARVLHMLTPYTAFGTSNGDGETAATVLRSYTGSASWFALWLVALCALAVTVALWREADHVARHRLTRVLAVVGVVAACALVLAVVNGNDRLYDTTPQGTRPVAGDG